MNPPADKETMKAPTPSAHEPLPADFLREYGAQKDMMCCNTRGGQRVWFRTDEFVDDPELVYAAPIGTVAAATTPLPEGRCDCGGLRGESEHIFATVHSSSCSIHRPYRHILPAALAALPERPDGLICCAKDWGPEGWQECTQDWPFKVTEHDRFLAYAIPAQSGQGKEGPQCVWRDGCSIPGQCRAAGCCLSKGKVPSPLSTQPEGGEEWFALDDAEHPVPRDGSPILVKWDYKPDYPPQAARLIGNSFKANSGIIAQEPTHWRPRPPSPPSTAGETPRADAAKVDAGYIIASHSNGEFVPLETARDLERQLAAAEAEREGYRRALESIASGLEPMLSGTTAAMMKSIAAQALMAARAGE